MRVEIFDVEHGFCALVTGRSGERVLIDCGHNSTTGWRPSNWLRPEPLDLLIITNYDQDHLSDFPGVQRKIGYRWLSANFSIAPSALSTLKREQGPLSTEMKTLINELEALGPITTFNLPSISWVSFRIPFPYGGKSETNKHSLVVFMQADGICIVFPGDLSAEGWRELLLQKAFRDCLNLVNVFVASHHGRLDGFSEDVFRYCKPDVVIISDDEIQFDTQRVNYSRYAREITVHGEPRYALTTRNDGKLTIESSATGFTVKASKEMPSNLSPIVAALLSHSQPRKTPPASSLLDLSPTAQALRALDLPPKTPSLLDLVSPRQGSILADLLKPPSQPPKLPASLLNSPREDSPIVSLLSELLKNRKKSCGREHEKVVSYFSVEQNGLNQDAQKGHPTRLQKHKGHLQAVAFVSHSLPFLN